MEGLRDVDVERMEYLCSGALGKLAGICGVVIVTRKRCKRPDGAVETEDGRELIAHHRLMDGDGDLHKVFLGRSTDCPFVGNYDLSLHNGEE